MYSLLKELFPIHRCLVGPGFSESINVLKKYSKLNILKFKTGTKLFDWEVPKGFKVNEVFIEDSKGNKYLNFSENHYYVRPHTKSFFGKMHKAELKKKIKTHPKLKKAIPLRPLYYKNDWGLSASQLELDNLPDDVYKVNVDVENIDSNLEIGIAKIRGRSKKTILVSSYLCHPHGANDNLSGVVVTIELLKLLRQYKNLEYSYIFAIWPETIGAIAFINKFKKEFKDIVGGFSCMIVGDSSPFFYKKSILDNSIIDRSFSHALKYSKQKHKIVNYFSEGSCERQFNSPGVRIPYGLISRGFTRFSEYHTSLDNVNLVKKKNLLETLQVCCSTIEVLERNFRYKPNYTCEPFMTKHGIYPHDLGAGDGLAIKRSALAYYDLINFADEKVDLLEIAEKLNISIKDFDRAIHDFKKV
jgi:aminopeptidase-like protein